MGRKEEKQQCGRFKRLISDISHEKRYTWLRKGNLKRKTESLLITGRNNTIRTNYIKARIDKTQQNSKYRSCDDRRNDQSYNKWMQQNSKDRLVPNGWATWSIGNCPHEQIVYAKSCPGECDTQTPLGFWHTNESLFSVRRPDFLIISNQKRTCRIVNYAVPADPRVKLKENEKKDEYFNLARKLKKKGNMKETVIPIVIGAHVIVTKGLVQELEDLEIMGRVETIQTTALRPARILRRVRGT